MRIQYYDNPIKRSPEIDALFSEHFPDSNQDGDIIVCSGGDGSMLHCIQKHLDNGRPFFGIGAGTVNFMMNDQKKILDKLKKIESGEVKLEFVKTFTLHADVIDGNTGKTLFSGNAVNDIVIGGDLTSYSSFSILSTDKSIDTKLRTTGMCISTPLGSTAYNKNLRGSVIPRLDYELFSFVTIGAEIDKKINNLFNLQDATIVKTDSSYDSFISFDCSASNRHPIKTGDIIKISPGKWFELGFLNKRQFEIDRLVKYSK